MSIFEGELQHCEGRVKRHQIGGMKPPAVAVPKSSSSNAKDACDYSPTEEAKLRSVSVTIVSKELL